MTSTRKIPYKDIDINFVKNSFSKDIQLISGEDCIKTSIKNLIFTRYGERPFQQNLGSVVNELLFAKATASTIINLKEDIKLCLENEPRVDVLEVDVRYELMESKVIIEVYYSLKNSDEVDFVNIPLKRLK